jgi:hypothetical protein
MTAPPSTDVTCHFWWVDPSQAAWTAWAGHEVHSSSNCSRTLDAKRATRCRRVLEHFRTTDEAHARGIRVITDLVLNHTSDTHHCFHEARPGARRPPSRPRGGAPDVRDARIGGRQGMVGTSVPFAIVATTTPTVLTVAGSYL